jgi:hypothetical protein
MRVDIYTQDLERYGRKKGIKLLRRKEKYEV